MSELHIGFDDTDSHAGMCTTFVVNRVINELGLEKKLLSAPELIRLNPTVPWKTRGNGALCIRLNLKKDEIRELEEEVIDIVSRYREDASNTGLVFFEEDPRKNKDLVRFSKKAVREVVSLQRARELIKKFGDSKEFGNGQGVVGALSACSHVFDDETYEFIAYRKREKWGTERSIEEESVKEVSEKYYPIIWDNYDQENNEVAFSPNTPGPVLFGLRGDKKEVVEEAAAEIECEEIFSHTIFRTNQGTDEHLVRVEEIDEIGPYTSVIIEGRVSNSPRTIEGGHVIFSIEKGGKEIDCAAYEPTKDFRDIIRELIEEDKIRVLGSVRKKPLTINLEKILVIDLKRDVFEKNPVCPECGRYMKSAGRNQGFRCKSCKIFSDEKVSFYRKRNLEEKMYEVPPGARRHLSKPLVRGR